MSNAVHAVVVALLLASGPSLFAGSLPEEASPAAKAQTAETIVVLGSASPAPLAESTASVRVEPVAPALLLVGGEQDLLRRDASVVLQQRGAGGGQADVALRGGSFGQTLVLVNGFRVNDAQTGHHNLDLPLPLEAMETVETLHGAGSTLHGEDALAGVVAFRTASPRADGLRVRSGYGSFGGYEESILAAFARRQWSARFTANRSQADGFMADRDYRNEAMALESWIASPLGVSNVLGAMSDRAFGANQFYGPYVSWERTKSWFAAIRQDLGPRTQAAFAYRRHTDEFVLVRSNPSLYANNHADDGWQASVQHRHPFPGLSPTSALLVGLEASGDAIHSTHLAGSLVTSALGDHAENRGAGYVDLDLRPAKSRWSLSAGLREAILSGGVRTVFSPHLALGYRLSEHLRARASGGYGYRLPSFTDRYYVAPGTQGNANLKPESAWSGEGGLDWRPRESLRLTATGFYSRQHNTIDYVKAAALPNSFLPPGCPVNTWCAANLNELAVSGAELAAEWRPARWQSVRASWSGLGSEQSSLEGAQSKYALNYPSQSFSGVWTASARDWFTVSNSLRVVKIYQQPGQAAWNRAAYPVWNVAIGRDTGKLRPYLRLDNLSNTGYQEISGVAMPGRAITGGLVLALSR